MRSKTHFFFSLHISVCLFFLLSLFVCFVCTFANKENYYTASHVFVAVCVQLRIEKKSHLKNKYIKHRPTTHNVILYNTHIDTA